MSPPGLSLKARALRYLAMREHSRAELERKLARHVTRNQADDGADGDVGGAVDDAANDAADAAGVQIARVLDELEAHGLLDERRAADALVASQARRFGALKLRQSLRDRGVDADAAAAALDAVAATEFQRACEVWQRRFGQPASDAAGRAKQALFLAGRGFGAAVIQRIVRGLDAD